MILLMDDIQPEGPQPKAEDLGAVEARMLELSVRYARLSIERDQVWVELEGLRPVAQRLRILRALPELTALSTPLSFQLVEDEAEASTRAA